LTHLATAATALGAGVVAVLISHSLWIGLAIGAGLALEAVLLNRQQRSKT
jgi:hypothetical protein